MASRSTGAMGYVEVTRYPTFAAHEPPASAWLAMVQVPARAQPRSVSPSAAGAPSAPPRVGCGNTTARQLATAGPGIEAEERAQRAQRGSGSRTKSRAAP